MQRISDLETVYILYNYTHYAKRTYSGTSVARTLMARLPRLFRSHPSVPNRKNPIAADIIVFGIILYDCLFILIMVYCVYS